MLIKLSSKSSISNYMNLSPKERMEHTHKKFPHVKKTGKVILGRDEDHIDYMTIRDKNAPTEDKKEFKKRIKNIVGGQVVGSLVGMVAGSALDKHLQKKYNVSTTPYGTIMGGAFGGAIGQVGGHRLTNRRLKRESATKTAAQQSQLRPGEKEENLELDNYKSELRKNRSYGRKVGGYAYDKIKSGQKTSKSVRR